MKQYNKILMFITIIICVLAFAGCKNIRFDLIGDDEKSDNKVTDQQDSNETKKENETEQGKADASKETTTKEVVTTKSEENDGKADSAAITIQPADNIELLIYTVNSDGEIEAVTAAIPEGEEITPQVIVDTVTESMADNSLMVGVENVSIKEDAVIISFYKDQPPVSDVGSGYETAILDAIAQSLIENLEDYSKVIYRVEGGAYTSGHIELDLNEAYLNK